MRGIVFTVGLFAFVLWDYAQNDGAYLNEFLRFLRTTIL